MEIPKAIELLNTHSKASYSFHSQDFWDAIKLGAEALIYIQRLRACSLQHRQTRLPSEDSTTLAPISKDDIRKARESPLGREPRG